MCTPTHKSCFAAALARCWRVVKRNATKRNETKRNETKAKSSKVK